MTRATTRMKFEFKSCFAYSQKVLRHPGNLHFTFSSVEKFAWDFN